MKTLFFFLALAFLVHAKANPAADPEAELDKATEPVPQDAGENGPAGDTARRVVQGTCYGGRGYCFLRHYVCRSGYMFKEYLNNCSNKRSYKCCVP